MKLFVDSDVILDVILNRKAHLHSKLLIDNIAKKNYSALTSPVIIANIYYIISKTNSKLKAIKSIKLIRQVFKISKVDQKTVDNTLNDPGKDFEDTLQYHSALTAKCTHYITRNIKHYPKNPPIPILSPEEFLATHS